MREIIRASAWSGFRELVTELGSDVDAILAAAQVDTSALDQPERYVPLRAFANAQAIAAERLNRKDFGLLFGQAQNLSAMGGCRSPSSIPRPCATASTSRRATWTCTTRP